MSVARVGVVDDQVRRRPLVETRGRRATRGCASWPPPRRRGPGGRHGPARRPRRRSGRARGCRRRRCRRGPGTPASCRSRTSCVPVGVQGAHARGEHAGTATRLGGDRLELPDLEQRRGDRDPGGGDPVDLVGRRARGVLEAVDAGVEQRVERLRREGVRGDPRARGVGRGDGVGQHVRGPQRAQVAVGAEVAVDPVGDELDPAVAARGLLARRRPAARRRPRARARSAAGTAWGGRGGGPPGSGAAGRRGRAPSRCRPASPASRTSSTPESRSARACFSAVPSSTGPSEASPMWQCTSTSPGRTQPSSTCIGSRDDGRSNVIRPPTTHASPTSRSSSRTTVPRRCRTTRAQRPPRKRSRPAGSSISVGLRWARPWARSRTPSPAGAAGLARDAALLLGALAPGCPTCP